MTIDARSARRLLEAHPDLRRVILRAAADGPLDFVVTEVARSPERQAQLMAAGASRTLRGRHVPECNACGLACAVDLAVKVDGEVRWDWPLYDKLDAQVKAAACAEGVPVEWGGDWPFRDGPHFQLPWVAYP